MQRKQLTAMALVIVMLVGAGAAYRWWPRLAPAPATSQPDAKPAVPMVSAAGSLKAGDVDPQTGKRILYYHDPMVPGQRFDRPGKSPYMDMMLVPVYAGDQADAGEVAISARQQQNLGVRTAEVMRTPMTQAISAVGAIAYNERDQVLVQARAAGYVERLHVRANLDSVVQGQALLDLYVPEWVAAQEEFLAVKRMRGEGLEDILAGAQQRMRQVGMGEDQIALVAGSGRTHARITLRSPLAGVVTELSAREGATVTAGQTLFRINGLTTVWVNAEVPESQSATLRAGLKVQAQTPAVPDRIFEGTLQAILPEVNPATRTLRVRMQLANPQARLVPGMFVTLKVMEVQARDVLSVPSEALIRTGTRTLVMVMEEAGRFRPVEVEAGLESQGRSEIKQGLQAGQRVVVSSQFLIDSEASLRGAQARFNEPNGEAPGTKKAAP